MHGDIRETLNMKAKDVFNPHTFRWGYSYKSRKVTSVMFYQIQRVTSQKPVEVEIY
jgi:hypothetical protein